MDELSTDTPEASRWVAIQRLAAALEQQAGELKELSHRVRTHLDRIEPLLESAETFRTAVIESAGAEIGKAAGERKSAEDVEATERAKLVSQAWAAVARVIPWILAGLFGGKALLDAAGGAP